MKVAALRGKIYLSADTSAGVKEKQTALIPVNVMVAGRSYRLRVAPHDEAFVRAAVKRMNDQIAELRRSYAAKDEQDFLAMCLLMYATEKQSIVAEAMLDAELQAMIQRIDKVLGE